MDTALKQRIDALQAELHSYYPLPEEIQDKIDRKFRLEFNYNSNHIEGNTLTYGETALYLFFDEVGKNPHTGREYEEMRASDVALKLVAEQARNKEQELTETFIKRLNDIILVRPYWKEAITSDGQTTKREISIGEYKKYPNSVRLQNGEIFHYTSPLDTAPQMTDMVAWFREEIEKKELHPVELAALLHYRFVRIHPFDDGNGRISRLLMNYVLLYNDFPPVIIKSSDKRNYLAALHDADVGELESFVNYVAEQLVWSLEISISAAKGESIEEVDDVEKEIEVYKKEVANISNEIVKKSDSLIEALYNNSLASLISLYKKKFEKNFANLFLNFTIDEYVNDVQQSNNERKSSYIAERMIASNAENVIKSTLKQIKPQSNEIRSFKIVISLKKYKHNGTNIFDVLSTLIIDFEDYKYRIVYEEGPLQYIILEKLYSQQLNEGERTEIVGICLRKTFEQIKQLQQH